MAAPVCTRLVALNLQEAITKSYLDKEIDKLTIKLSKLFIQQGSAIVRELSVLKKYLTESASDDFDKLFDRTTLDTSSAMYELLVATITKVLFYAGKDLLTTFDSKIVFSLTNPRAVAYIKTVGADLIAGIDETTKQTIKTIVLIGISNGISYTELAQQIKQQFKQFAVNQPQKHIRSRAELIAVTELGNAYSEGNLISARMLQDSGIPMEKLWQTVGDKRVSIGCRANAAGGWVDVDQSFISGHQRPVRFPGCRCTALYRVKR